MDRPDEPVRVALAAAEEDLARLGRELTEIAMLEQQARAEAGRHEQRRAQAADRLAATQARHELDPAELRDAVAQLITLTRRSALMDAQTEVLAGKQKALTRYRDSLASLVSPLHAAFEQGPLTIEGEGDAAGEVVLPAAASRAILSAQEDLRRDIARAMHDGPAQSLTNIALQAQIVERLVSRNPEAALAETRVLVEMVQRTLEATKTFIFNVRPMVLDDLGLVPTLRRVARDRSRDAQVPVEFDSVGPDRRLELELETGVFRVIDEAVVAFLETSPARVSLDLAWDPDSLHVRVRAVHTAETVLALPAGGIPQGEPAQLGTHEQGEDLPPALAAMIREQRADDAARAVVEAPVNAAPRGMSAAAWRDVEQRARSLGIEARLSDGGTCLDLAAALVAA